MRRKIKLVEAVFVFYFKTLPFLILLSLFFSLLGATGFNAALVISTAKVFVVMTPVALLFTYEVRYRNDYFFYFNLGLSKGFLWAWAFTISCSLAGAALIFVRCCT